MLRGKKFQENIFKLVESYNNLPILIFNEIFEKTQGQLRNLNIEINLKIKSRKL